MEFLTRSASIRDRVRVWRAAGPRIALVPTRELAQRAHAPGRGGAGAGRSRDCLASSRTPANAMRRRSRQIATFRKSVRTLSSFRRSRRSIPGARFLGARHVPSLADVLEGAFRPRLLRRFDRSGQALQSRGARHCRVRGAGFSALVIVRRLVEDLFLSIEIVGCPTCGTAMGSRWRPPTGT